MAHCSWLMAHGSWSLALLLLDVGNASERLAAARRLVLDDRCREVVLAHLRRTRDAELARAIAMAAATDLPGAWHFAGAGPRALQERDGVAATWFARHGVHAAIVRPDHYVFGVAADAAHLAALRANGISSAHRLSFGPVKSLV